MENEELFKKASPGDSTDVLFPYKVELHVHLDGALRPQTIFDHARRKNMPLPVNTVEELTDYLTLNQTQNLDILLRAFRTFMPIVAGDKELIHQMAYEFCETCSQLNIGYAEARYSPHLLANTFPKPYYAPHSGSFSPRDVVATINNALRKGCNDFNVNVKTILCCYRDTPEWSLEVSELCRDFKSDGVVGIDIAGPEYICGKDSQHVQAFLEAEKNGIHRTAHAGEITPVESVIEALDDMHVERIGHGYSCLLDDAVYRRIKEERIHLETCPISSIMTGGADKGKVDHPVARFAEDDVNFSINTDDPTVLNNSILDDYNVAMDMGLTKQQIIRSIFNAARSSFAPENEKKKVIEDLVKVYGQH